MPKRKTQMEERRILGTHEVARMFSVDAGTVMRWADAGRLPSFRTPGGHRRMLRDDVLAFARGCGWPLAEASHE